MQIKNPGITLDEFTLKQYLLFPSATGQLSSLLRDIGLAAKRINAEINKAGLLDITGFAGTKNIQGEEVKKLDIFANEQLIKVLQNGISCAGAGSEENEGVLIFNTPQNNNSKYIVLFDPLDGSDNIGNNISIGTIFGIYRRASATGTPCTGADFIQKGLKQEAAGYILYGSSTMLVYATRQGVNGFTLDPNIGEFCLSHENIQCPKHGAVYSFNFSNLYQYPEYIRSYIDAHLSWNAHNPGSYTARYVGSMVADLHRTLLQGGIFMYPGTIEKPGGKLRMQYECNPFAFIFKMAGGKASNGFKEILDLQPAKLHERSPLFIGSAELVDELMAFTNNGPLQKYADIAVAAGL